VRSSPPTPPRRPLPSTKPSVYVCPSCYTISLESPSCPHPYYTITPAEPDYLDAMALYTDPPF
jgi:hypothetical protein